MSNKKTVIILSALVLVLVSVVLIGFNVLNLIFPDGKTLGSRQEQIMNKMNGSWYIASEQEIENFIVSGIYGENNEKSGIAVFERQKNGKYKLVSTKVKNNDDIIIEGFSYKGERWYDIAFFNGAVTKYAEMIYTIDGEVLTYKFETDKSALIYNDVNAKEYKLEVSYYDNEGNKYE